MFQKSVKAALLMLLFSISLLAHPHLFIDVSARFVINDSGLDGIQVLWEIDDMNSAMMVEHYDRNSDGVFDESERAEIEKVFNNLSMYNYYTTVEVDGRGYDFGRVENFVPSITHQSRIQYAFFIPVSVSFDVKESKEITITFSDPEIYTAFFLDKNLIQATSDESFSTDLSFRTRNFAETIVLEIFRSAD
ncbi:DUF1007 family protein [Chitinispirillales bacterium ANBcel5]|uniref:DUF1007 family protein n=1 Tax=Cellulosispirillum alkaliphilum TaxID=3039283 RepID=UPI002A537A1B|nr:DUF1007 family protein [Chitinispirillales bacterium ANBcel5]